MTSTTKTATMSDEFLRQQPACVECGAVQYRKYGHMAECSQFLEDAQPPERDAGLRDDERCLKCGRTTTGIHRLHYLGGEPTDCNHQWAMHDDRNGQSDTGQPERETQTSELPWTLGKNGDKCAENHAICSGPAVIAKVYGRGYPISSGWSPRSEADAKLIVTAVNSHASLIAALERTRKFLLLLTDAGVLDQIAAELSSPDEVNALCDQIDGALKHAREGE